ncbi:tryptophan 2,3-dioxygenase family protein [Streptomyces cocklensis]|jgi:tryptophan 2,3-dioxygenase|uniref:Tryptophan 2,3-dioxygenase n=1 Tax=Actinacidiphila cocklensis TaxID=887465 RepID=A0A9W4DY94_9ACTN|nr:tryptophan 2,3-dioxygenase family protein [Actinacidiphila cocklensis]MDD1062041.1 tryptophan 2,3-dioxygenase family protein [Actinacidiphila cocklensis]WSX74782.1 tryptophan 2,3-dioxygenase family protein [Streptomyces sp. NBC_00899]CAG6398708.1 Tryptophan 2,3-dioxygenase [Actinacidiphila cocklensis]
MIDDIPAGTPEGAAPDGPCPYDAYVHASVLGSLQQPLTASPDEMGFLITTQVMELWFALLVHEWRSACEALAADRLPAAMDCLERSRRAHLALNACWTPLAALTPARFNAFRAAFGQASGAQSARYRMMEFLLAQKSRAFADAHRDDPVLYAELLADLRAPSLWDQVLRFLHRQGHEVPPAVLRRDVSEPYEPSEGVGEVWRRIYAGGQHDRLLRLGELLTDVAELVQRWRSDHLLVVRRAMGDKPGTGGTSGTAWLAQRAARPVFPELWTVRADV